MSRAAGLSTRAGTACSSTRQTLRRQTIVKTASGFFRNGPAIWYLDLIHDRIPTLLTDPHPRKDHGKRKDNVNVGAYWEH
jgi:hypothetical protein